MAHWLVPALAFRVARCLDTPLAWSSCCGTWLSLPCAWFARPCAWLSSCLVPSSRGLVPGSRCRVPGSLGHVPGSRGLVPGSRCRVPGSRGRVPGSRGRVPGSRGRVPRSPFTPSPARRRTSTSSSEETSRTCSAPRELWPDTERRPNVVDATRTLGEAEIVYLGRPPLRIDLLRSIDGVSATDVLKNAVLASWEGTAIRVIALDDLIANKRAAGRPQDLADLVKLERFVIQ